MNHHQKIKNWKNESIHDFFLSIFVFIYHSFVTPLRENFFLIEFTSDKRVSLPRSLTEKAKQLTDISF